MTSPLIGEKHEQERSFLQIPNDCRTLLVGEGRNDARFLFALARRETGNAAAYGHWIGSESNVPDLIDDVNAAVKAGDFLRLRSFALVLDADTSESESMKKINSCMKECFRAYPEFSHGEVRPLKFKGEEILVGAFVMPGRDADGCIQGALEDLVLRAAKQTHKQEMECVYEFRRCVLERIGNKSKKEQDEEKKKAQAFLSTLPESKPLLGAAAEDGVLNFSAPAYDELKVFLRKLSP